MQLSEFNKQQTVQDEITNKIDSLIYIHLVKSFNDAKENHKKQAVIEVAQDYGFTDLAIELMAS